MIYRTIPHTDLHVSSICLGSSLIGSSINETDSFRLLDLFVDLGGNFIDTSLNYADWSWPVKGISEKTIGKWLKQTSKRDQVIVGTKGACPQPKGGKFFRLSPEEIAEDLERSLLNLQVDHIDLYWLHRDDVSQPVEGVIDFLHEQVEKGKIRYFACSNWSVERMEAARIYAENNGKHFFVANQMMWSLAVPNPGSLSDQTLTVMDQPMIDFHHKHDMAAIPFSSQASGFFSAKYHKDGSGHRLKEHKASQVRMYYNEVNLARFERVQTIAAQIGSSPSAVALAWMFAHPFPVYPIIGSRTPEQLQDSCLAGELRLDEQTVRWIAAG